MGDWEQGSHSFIENSHNLCEIIVHNEMWQSKNSAIFRCTINNLKTSLVKDIIFLV